MNVLITGGTGLIGSAVCLSLLKRGYNITVLSRSPEKVSRLFSDKVKSISNVHDYSENKLDVIINLSGEPIADKRWTDSQKEKLLSSRVGLTRLIYEWLKQSNMSPKVLISGSAVGWYGDFGNEEALESCQQVPGDFSSFLCEQWELNAKKFSEFGTRVVIIRTGLVLAKEQGLLKKLVPLFAKGLGGKNGNGTQWMPWIHIEDQIRAILFLLDNHSLNGAFNLCSPYPVQNNFFCYSLGAALHKKQYLNLPSWFLKLIFGEMSI